MGDFSAGQLVVGMMMSTAGIIFLRIGRKERRMPQLLAGVLMLAAPLLVHNALLLLLLSGVVLFAVWWATHNGW